MTSEQRTARLARLKNYRTNYELVASNGDRRYLVAYSSGKSRDAIFKCVSNPNRVQAMIRLTGDERIHFAKRAADGAKMGDWTIRFSGRTQRDCIMEGELEYVGEIPSS